MNEGSSDGGNKHLHNMALMNRYEMTERIVAKLKGGEAIVGGIGNTNFDLWSTGQRAENFYMLGSMGLAIPIALGVALAQPGRKIIALEGDGSLLMQLGCLSTVAICAPKNLTIVLWDNSMYQITGAQPTATAHAVDLVGVARASGLSRSNWAADEQHFDALFEQACEAEGPALIAVKIDGKSAVAQTERDPVRIRDRFVRAIQP
jgi:thiamine pyrophosphate-dependent acetolactate synthase large subunit-like protein